MLRPGGCRAGWGETSEVSQGASPFSRFCWEQSEQQSPGTERQIPLAQCSKHYFISKSGPGALENKWQVYLH